MAIIAPKPSFELHGVKLYGSFGIYFEGGKWYKENYERQETKISGHDLEKLAKASKTGIEVSLKIGNGEGKAKIRSLHYDPTRSMLKSISFELISWTPK